MTIDEFSYCPMLDEPLFWGMFEDEAHEKLEDYAIRILELSSDCLDYFKASDCDGVCKTCLVRKNIEAYRCGMENLADQLSFEGYEVPNETELLYGFRNNYGWKIISPKKQYRR